MIEIAVHNMQGQEVDRLSIDEQTLGGHVRPPLLKQAFVRYHANRRLGSAATRSRGSVSGSTRKLYRQKGTGNARRGALRTVIARGGGVAFAKHPKSWRLGMPRKMRRLANRNALLAKAVDGEIKLVDDMAFDKPSTRRFTELLGALQINRSCLVALDSTNGHVASSARNVPRVDVTRGDHLNVFDLLNHRYLLAPRSVIEAWIKGAAAGEAG
jgi:large subunit ribosomal protein L4